MSRELSHCGRLDVFGGEVRIKLTDLLLGRSIPEKVLDDLHSDPRAGKDGSAAKDASTPFDDSRLSRSRLIEDDLPAEILGDRTNWHHEGGDNLAWMTPFLPPRAFLKVQMATNCLESEFYKRIAVVQSAQVVVHSPNLLEAN
jgi:hypothetical protein